MLLAVDVGNTETKLGVFDGENLLTSWRWATDPAKLADQYAAQLGWLLEHAELSYAGIRQVVVASVVPQLTPAIVQLAERYIGCPALCVSAGSRTGMALEVDNPAEVGADRIANALAARSRYGVPAVVVDFGTATNFDVVSSEGAFVGGAFAPGLGSAVEGLLARAARLQPFEMVAPGRAIGKNTIACLQSGTVYGYVGLVEGLLARIEGELGQKAHVIGTGGLVDIVARETRVIQIVDPNLTLHGLRLIASFDSEKAA